MVNLIALVFQHLCDNIASECVACGLSAYFKSAASNSSHCICHLSAGVWSHNTPKSRLSLENLAQFGQKTFLNPFLSGVPAYLYRVPVPPSRRGRRGRGKRSGRLVKLNCCLARCNAAFFDDGSVSYRLVWRGAVDLIGSWLIHVVCSDEGQLTRCLPFSLPTYSGVW